MALLFPLPSMLPSTHKSISGFTRNNPLTPNSSPFPPVSNPWPIHQSLTSRTLIVPSQPRLSKTQTLSKASAPPSSSFTVADSTDDPGEEDPAASPWEGAVVYRRDASVAHLEYCTTLERLGLGRLSTDLSRAQASAMGIRLPPRRAKVSPPDEAGTPVLISLDVTRRRKRILKLDGIVRTVITLGCNRCAESAAERVFSNFTLLLTEEPIKEPDEINMGTIFGQYKTKTFTGSSNEEDEDDEEQIDLDDRLYFPAEEKEIDISKHIRDIVHVEITINAVCDASCKGLCLKCGTNLNKRKCNCSKEKVQDKEYGPLKSLRKQVQRR